jgi:flagellar biogenesis protein FliO
MTQHTTQMFRSHIALLVFSFLGIVVVPQLTSSPQHFSSQTLSNLANVVGMSVGVPQNETNKLAQDLETKSVQLSEREKAIDAREREFRAIVVDENARQMRLTILLISGATLFLITLIGLNFYLDRKRGEGLGRITMNKRNDTHAHAGEFTTKL